MKPANAQAIILNLGDGLTTSLSYLIPMVVGHGAFNGKALVIGATGGATSMAFNLDDSENGLGTRTQFILAFISSLGGGVLPVLPFIFLSEPFSAVLSILLVLVGITIILQVKRTSEGFKPAIKQIVKSIVPAIVLVGGLSLL